MLKHMHKVLAGLALWCTFAAVQAQPEPPGRVGRLADMQGKVWFLDTERGQWVEAVRNRPLTTGDRLATEGPATARVNIGSTTLWLGPRSELELRAVDDQRVQMQLHAGDLAMRTQSRETAVETEVITNEGRFLPQRAGLYRVDRVDNASGAMLWRGDMRFEAADGRGAALSVGNRLSAWWNGRVVEQSWSVPIDDRFAQTVLAEDHRDGHGVSARYVSPETTGYEDLDRYGRWQTHPEYGAIWVPQSVAPGWAPYRFGHWTWFMPWGWTWMDDAPWGFTPFHYGRWQWFDSRWAWVPGPRVSRPVFAPALVGWVGGPNASAQHDHSRPPAAWVPLAPRDAYRPIYPHGEDHWQRLNPGRGPMPQPRVPTGPVSYGNRGVSNAVTVVPAEVVHQQQPVAPAHQGRAAEQPRWPGRDSVHAQPPAPPVATPRQTQTPAVASPVVTPVVVPQPPGRERNPGQGRVDEPRRQPIAAPAQVPKPALTPAVPEATKPAKETPRERREEDSRPRAPESRQNLRERQQVQ